MMTEKIGPVQLVVIGFPLGAEFEGRIMAELERLERHETTRILDLLFVGKDAETGALLGFEFDGEQPNGTTEDIQGHAFGLSRTEMQEMAASLEPGNSAGFLLVEHVWARDLKSAVRDAGGFPLGDGFLTPEALAAVGTELVATSEAIEELETEEAGAGA